MSNNSPDFSQQDGFNVIQQMIQSAKQEQKDDGRGWILWGWLLFLTSVFTVLNLHWHWLQSYFFWNLFGLATLVIVAVNFVRSKRRIVKKRVNTYINEVFSKLNIGFAITLALIIVAINVNVLPRIGFGLLMSLYGFWMLIYGALFNFKPSIIGAYCTWALALLALFMATFRDVMILHAIAVLVGYIIPGHIAYKQYNQLTGRQ